MEPIISPWIIYLIGMVDTCNELMMAVAVVGTLLAGVSVGVTMFDGNGDIRKGARGVANWLVPIAVTAIMLTVLIPSRNTIIAMYTASVVTKDSVAGAVEAGTDLKDVIKGDIIDIIQALDEGEEE